MSSTFNPEEFLAQTFTESSRKSFPPVPPGEYLGTIKPDSLALKFVGADNKPVLEMQFIVTDQRAVDACKIPEPTVRYTCWLEKGANGVDIKNSTSLGRLRDAIGLNTEGQAWSFSQFGGRQARIYVETEQSASGDEFAKVKRVTKP